MIKHVTVDADMSFLSGEAAHYRGLIELMLQRDPGSRPGMQQVAERLAMRSTYSVSHPMRAPVESSLGTVIVPARMAVPHCGHIEYLSRLLEVGYSLIVSLQYSYFHDLDNPIPKWLVLKMIAKSLQRKGHDPSNIRWICTPMFETDERHRFHFSMMPGVRSASAVVTGNEDVLHLFPSLPWIDQKIVFGKEGELHENRSWGARLRKSIRDSDLEVFRELIADGAEEILSFEEIRSYCLQPQALGFVWRNDRRVYVVLHRPGSEDLRQQVFVYETPEDAILRLFSNQNAEWIDRWSRESTICIDGRVCTLQYKNVEFDSMSQLCIHYELC